MGGIISRGCGFRSMPLESTESNEHALDSHDDRHASAARGQPSHTPDTGQDAANDLSPPYNHKASLAHEFLEKASGSGAWMSRHSLLGFDTGQRSLSKDHLAGSSQSSALRRPKSSDSLTQKAEWVEHLDLNLDSDEESLPETIEVDSHQISADPHRLLRHMSGAGKSLDDVEIPRPTAQSLHLPREAGPLLEGRSQQWFIMRTSAQPMSREAAQRNRIFAIRASRACLDEAKRIGSGEHKTLMEVWDAATTFRVSALPEKNPSFATPRNVFTFQRNTPTQTPIFGAYDVLLSNDGTNGAVDASKQNVFQRQEIEIGGKTIPLTELIFQSARHFRGVTLNGRMDHTEREHIPELMQHCETLTQEILSDSVTPTRDDKLTRLGELQWIMAQAMPDRRGSAFKSEFCTRSLALAKDIVLPPYREGVAPDLEAFANTREEFVRRFAAVFDPARAKSSLFEQP